MRRREFVAHFAGALLGAPAIGFAQKDSKVWRVGLIAGGGSSSFLEEFPIGMRELGYEVGKNLAIEWRLGEGHFDRLPAMAADLVSKKVDVIVCSGTPAVEAAKRATSTIPIVMGLSGDPVASGLVASLARPGGNVTGLSLATTDTSSKWLELARIVAPKSQVGVLADPNQPTAQWHVKNIESAAQALGVKTPVAYTRGADQIEGSIASLGQAQVKTVIVLPGGLFDSNAARIAQLALKHRMAAIGTTRFYAEKGALLSYGQSYGAFMRRAATYVDKIFKGAKPSELPVEQPAIFELVINMATAKQLGLTIPKELLFRADKLI